NRERRDKELEQERLLFRRVRRNRYVVLLELTDQRGVRGFRVIRDERVAVTPAAANGFALEHDFLDGAILDPREERRIGDRLEALAVGSKTIENGQQDDRDDDPENDVLCQIVQCVTSRNAPRSPFNCRPYYIP